MTERVRPTAEHGPVVVDDDDDDDDRIEPPDVSHLVTEDDTPVESLFQEKQMRLLAGALYSSWKPLTEDGAPRSFLAAADVGIFATARERAVVPDVLLSMDVSVPEEFWRKDKRSYYIWEFGKPPEIVIEVISNREGGELDEKRAVYSRLRIAHYVVYDHLNLYGPDRLRVFELRGDLLVPSRELVFPRLGLGLVEWTGTFELAEARWLRWCDLSGATVPTGQERAEHERERAEHERERAEHERERAEHEKRRADALAERLRALGVDVPGE